MKAVSLALALILTVLLAGCAVGGYPKPTQTDAKARAQTTVLEAEATYALVMHEANKYVTRCRQTPTTAGCNSNLVTSIEQASDKAWTALQNAWTSVNALPAGATGIDEAIAAAEAAMSFLTNYTKQIPK